MRAFICSIKKLVGVLLASCLVIVGLGWHFFHRRDLRHWKEDVLRQDLLVLRRLTSQYTLDNQRAPQSLDELVWAHYLNAIPIDPFTGKADWVPDFEDSLMAVDQQEPGIVDVHSSSNQIASDGTAYSSW